MLIRVRRIAYGFLCFAILSSSFCNGCAQISTIGKQWSSLTLSPGEDNPRNSEGDFVTLKDGRVLFIYSHFTGSSSDDFGNAFLAGRYSRDGGSTWDKEDRIIVPQEGRNNVMSVSLLRLKDGRIALFYLRKNSMTDCVPMVRFSVDEGDTWSDPIRCIKDREGYFVLNNARVIQLEDGRILMPVAQHATSANEWNNAADLFVYFSDDGGQSWSSSRQVGNPRSLITQEPGLIALQDGRIMMYVRAEGGVQLISYSDDRGISWSSVEPGNISSPLSPATMSRIPSTGDLLLIWNGPGNHPFHIHKRTPLTAAISNDEGKTWTHIKNIEDDPEGYYCYTSIRFVGESVLLSYCSGKDNDGSMLTITELKKIPLSWFYDE